MIFLTLSRRKGTLSAHFMGNNVQGKYMVFALRAAGDMTITIAAPAIAAAFVGRALDGMAGTGRAFFIGFMLSAALVTVYTVVKKARHYGDLYKKLVDEPGNGSVGR